MNETDTVVVSPYCRNLRSKRWYFLEGPPRQESDILDGSNDCWCRCTGMAVGPDGEVVDPEDCERERSCYEPYGPRA